MPLKINTKGKKRQIKKRKNVEKYGEVGLQEELICTLDKIKKLKKNNLKQKDQLQKYEEDEHDSKAKMSQSLEEIEKAIMNPNFQLEEEIMIEEVVRIQLKEKE
jgi:hypothetical protein